MTKSRKHRESPDLSDEDRHRHKHSRRSGHHHDHHTSDIMASHKRNTADDRHDFDQRKHGKHARHRRDSVVDCDRHSPEDRATAKKIKHSDHDRHKHCTADVGCQSRAMDDESRTERGHDTNTTKSDSSDEILIKHRVSRRHRRDNKVGDVSRQIQNIEKAQRDALRSSSREGKEIHIHYHPIVTRSASPPRLDYDDHRPVSFAATDPETGRVSARKSLAKGLSANDLRGQLKRHSTSMSTKRSPQQATYRHRRSPASPHRCSPVSPRRTKHERHDKYSKKRLSLATSTSKFLVPLAQRWCCYNCGKIRSSKFQGYHPLRPGKKMHPNWCSNCRVQSESKGTPLQWNGQQHYCWGCGIVRSVKYHDDHPMRKGKLSIPNYCQHCRELSPSFERNLHETSELASELDHRDQALRRQMYDATMSDIEEVENECHETTSAPGKENEDPSHDKTVRATRSFILRHGSSTAKITSDSSFSSSQGSSDSSGIPIEMLKAMHLEADRARGFESPSTKYRLSDASFQALYAEDNEVSMQDASSTSNSGDVKKPASKTNPLRDQRRASASKACQTAPKEDPSPPLTSILHRTSAIEPDAGAATASSNKKHVRWSEDFLSHPATKDSAMESARQSDSGVSSCRSDNSSSTRGKLRRLRPGDYSSGSPPEREDSTLDAQENSRDNGEGPSNLQRNTSERGRQGPPRMTIPGNSNQHLPPSQGTFGNDVGGADGKDGRGHSNSHGKRTNTEYPATGSFSSNQGHSAWSDYYRQQHQQAPPAYPSFSCYAAPAMGENDAYRQQYMYPPGPQSTDGARGYYDAYAPQGWGMPSNWQGQQQQQQSSYGFHPGNASESYESYEAPRPSSPFDFSGLGGGSADAEPKFVRRKKNKTKKSNDDDAAGAATTVAAPNEPTAAISPRPPQSNLQWSVYEHPVETNYQWHDGHAATMDNLGGSGPSMTSPYAAMGSARQPRNLVTILSIREITSDEEMEVNDSKDTSQIEDDQDSSSSGDDDDFHSSCSDVVTVVQDDYPDNTCQN